MEEGEEDEEEEEVRFVYPLRNTDNVVLRQKDVDLLDPEKGRFLNDSIIDFYFAYLRERYSRRFGYFTCFFLRKVANSRDLDDIRGWVSFNIFDKDYLLFPVNEDSHWYLIVVAKPIAMNRKIESRGAQSSSSFAHIDRCVIAVLDSLPGSRADVAGLDSVRQVRRYLEYEYNRRFFDTYTDDKAVVRRGDVVRQLNFHDCGVHLLYNAEVLSVGNEADNYFEDVCHERAVELHASPKRLSGFRAYLLNLIDCIYDQQLELLTVKSVRRLKCTF